MRFFPQLSVLVSCVLLCSCDNRGSGSKIYKDFDPNPSVLKIGKSKGVVFSASNGKENWSYSDGGEGAIEWIYYTQSDVTNPFELACSLRDLFKKASQQIGANIDRSDEANGSFAQSNFSYQIGNRAGLIVITVTKHYHGTDLQVRIQELEHAAPCNL